MEIFTIELIWYIFTAIVLSRMFVYFLEKEKKLSKLEIDKWIRWYNEEAEDYKNLLKHSNWLDSSLKRMAFKYDQSEHVKEKILEQARLWKMKFEKAEQLISFMEDKMQRMDLKNKELHKKIINDSRPLQGTKKTWKIKKPNTISRSQVYRRKKEVCE